MSIPIGAAIGQAAEAHSAEKKGAQQQQAGYQQAINAYQPYNQIGQGAASTLAGYLGIPVAEAPPIGAALPPASTARPAPWLQKVHDRDMAKLNQEPQTLSALLAKHIPPASAPSATNTMSRPQTPSAKSRSSYRMEMN